MDPKEFIKFSTSMAEYITQYLENIRDRRVLPSVKPGYLRPLLPPEAPESPDDWNNILTDVEKIIMPGVTHWHSPKFHAYFSAAQSYPAIVADMLSGAIGCIGLSWIASPACTELEVVMLDWLGKMLDLPPAFLSCCEGKGGGVIQGSACESTLITLLAAKAKAVRKVKQQHPEWSNHEIISKLVFYTSDQANSSIERASLLTGLKLRHLSVDDRFRLRGEVLRPAIEKDRSEGLIPFYAVATLGTTGLCAFDAVRELGEICNKEQIWLHVDAAYAGSAFICPEFRHLMDGVELTDSFNFNPHKWLLVNFDCSALWFKDPSDFIDAYNVDPIYLKHDNEGIIADAPDFRHWQIPLSRRFRSLKLWFVLRLYGKANLQAHIRNHVAQAHQFEDLVKKDSRFEIIGEVIMGLVCFRLKGSNELNERLLQRIVGNGKIYLIPAKIFGKYVLRFAICSRYSQPEDIQASWDEICCTADQILSEKC